MKHRMHDGSPAVLLRCVAVLAAIAAPFAASGQTWTEVFPTIADNATVTNLVVKAGEYKQASAKYSVSIGSGVVVQPGGMFRTRITMGGMAKENSLDGEQQSQPATAAALLPRSYGAHIERCADGLAMRYELPKASHVEWTIFDIRGRMVAQMLNQSFEPGWYSKRIEEGMMPTGSYVYRFKAGEEYGKSGRFSVR